MLVLNQKTLVPISTIVVISIAMFYLAHAYAKVLSYDTAIAQVSEEVKENKKSIKDNEKSINSNLIEILQRLSRIEEAVSVKTRQKK